ncbi:Meiotically up-regulated protein [Apiospora arundinis]
MRKGKTDAKVPSPKEWEDVAGLGMILRELATTHVTGNDDASNSNDADGDEDRVNRNGSSGRAWPVIPSPRPPQGRTQAQSQHNRPPLRLHDARPDGTHGYDDLPDMEWVVHKFLPSAQSQVKWRDYHMSNGISTWEAMGGNYKTGDVSWTRPSRLMPFACGGDDGHGVARLQRLKALL